ncbi:MAG: hypothetical protein ABW185_24650 [Sedimenticola sp.]
MDNYRKMVKRYADEKNTELIPNGGTDHAEILIENIFSHAHDTVRVFTGTLNARVYGSDGVVEKAAEFLLSNKNSKLEILLQDIDDIESLRGHPLINACGKIDEDRCVFKSANEKEKSASSHFVTMDNLGYRVEPDKSKPAGIGCFNDPKLAVVLNDYFDTMFDRGTTLKPPARQTTTTTTE